MPDNYLSQKHQVLSGGYRIIGDIGFQETVGAVLAVDPWGLDTITRKYIVRADRCDAVVDRLKRGKTFSDWQFPMMTMTSYSVTYNGALCEFSITCKGVIAQQPNAPGIPANVSSAKFSSGTRQQVVSLGFLSKNPTLNEAIDQVVYNSPTTTIKYAVSSKPQSRIFNGFVDYIEDSIQIKSRTFPTLPINLTIGNSFTRNTRVPPPRSDTGGPLESFNGVIECINQSFKFDQEGSWWLCEEQNEVVIQQRNFLKYGIT